MPFISGDADLTFHKLFAREDCVECQDGSPSCPSCDDDEVCQVSVPLDCTQCPQAYCAVSSTSTSTSSKSSSSKASTGAIAGGVVGGVVLIALVVVGVYFVWKHKIKGKRDFEQEGWQGAGGYADSQHEKGFQSRRNTRATSQGRNSVASTVLTRASNIIQIAYIPGVTNRATPTSPTLLVPPVPPIPIAMGSQAGTPNSTEDQHFFVPGDLRDSVCSGVSGYTDRTSFARTSYAPRSSVASTIYGKAGVVVTPAQTGMRAKAAMVSVKSMGSSNSGEGLGAPPVPAIDMKKYTNKDPSSPADSTFSVGSTFLNNASSANTATAVRAQVVRVGSSLNPSSTSSIKSTTENMASPQTPVTSPPRDEDSPFRDPPASSRRSSSQTLSAVIEEATKRASQRPGTADRAKSPFGDEHAAADK
ncbi:overproduction-induced pheromone-resistant [Gnomoniopsis smithogilvyi]|uniref:Overproduction-induced pheromone-resistant n=1 Tax=Gnomoniopsis smithogilvyi TaxID=1191159 RepID=A0A9W8Z1M6_9PEZI|nr:overproduction-induced pheromone-resistant [Gnomoniopsis smithogilvyi]